MKASSIRRHLARYRIGPKRATTINHAFASAVAPVEHVELDLVIRAMKRLGQRDAEHLTCVYCDREAQTWDHLHSLVIGREFSGYGHSLGNLVPSCKDCNSRKGAKAWKDWMKREGATAQRIRRIERHAQEYGAKSASFDRIREKSSTDLAAMRGLRDQILELLSEADKIADRLHQSESD